MKRSLWSFGNWDILGGINDYLHGFQESLMDGGLGLLAASGLGTIPAIAAVGAGQQAPLLTAQAMRGIRSLENQIALHEQKLAEFKANPTVRPGMEGQPAEVIARQQQARIQHLETEIRTFQDNIAKILRGEL